MVGLKVMMQIRSLRVMDRILNDWYLQDMLHKTCKNLERSIQVNKITENPQLSESRKKKNTMNQVTYVSSFSF